MSKNSKGAAPTAADVVNYNMQVRGAILQNGVPQFNQIYSRSVDPVAENVLNIPIRNVGLIRGFLVKVSGTIRSTHATGTLARTEFGMANVLSRIAFTDLSNTVRIQTSGWHLAFVNSAKQPLVFGGAYSPNVPINYGSNFDVQTGPATVAANNTDAAVQFYYYVPLSYSKNDLRGAMFAGVVNATAQLQLTINPNPVSASGDATLAIYKGVASGTGGWKSGALVTVTVWQDYIDQLPTDRAGNVILPPIDMNTIYELKDTALSGLVVGQDYGIAYANYRAFVSTVAVFNNGGTLAAGTDINYWAMRAANTTELFKYGPEEAALFARSTFMADLPLGTYYFDHRERNISTIQFGNMELTINPSLVNANAAVLVGFESFAQISQVQYAGSLPTGG